MVNVVHELIGNGFFSALGTMEEGSGGQMVLTGHPMSWDTNNGIVVVYDDEGRPWIRSRKLVPDDLRDWFFKNYPLNYGGYVPHSNDGGKFRAEVLEKTGIEI